MSYERLLFEVRDDSVARITLNRPEALNAMDPKMTRELMGLAIQCDEDPDIRAVLITGSGAAFCAGGDVGGFVTAGDRLPALIKEMTHYFHAAISRFAHMDAPVICAVNGVAAGGGMSFVCAMDLVIAAERARFDLAYTRAALTPDGSSTFYLARQVGLRRAQELVLTNRILSASEALDWGLVTRVVPDDELMNAAESLAVELAKGPTRSFGTAKRLLIAGATQGLETQMEDEARAIADSSRTADTKEGVAAFLEKRAPVYTGQ